MLLLKLIKDMSQQFAIKLSDITTCVCSAVALAPELGAQNSAKVSIQIHFYQIKKTHQNLKQKSQSIVHYSILGNHVEIRIEI